MNKKYDNNLDTLFDKYSDPEDLYDGEVLSEVLEEFANGLEENSCFDSDPILNRAQSEAWGLASVYCLTGLNSLPPFEANELDEFYLSYFVEEIRESFGDEFLLNNSYEDIKEDIKKEIEKEITLYNMIKYAEEIQVVMDD